MPGTNRDRAVFGQKWRHYTNICFGGGAKVWFLGYYIEFKRLKGPHALHNSDRMNRQFLLDLVFWSRRVKGHVFHWNSGRMIKDKISRNPSHNHIILHLLFEHAWDQAVYRFKYPICTFRRHSLYITQICLFYLTISCLQCIIHGIQKERIGVRGEVNYVFLSFRFVYFVCFTLQCWLCTIRDRC